MKKQNKTTKNKLSRKSIKFWHHLNKKRTMMKKFRELLFTELDFEVLKEIENNRKFFFL